MTKDDIVDHDKRWDQDHDPPFPEDRVRELEDKIEKVRAHAERMRLASEAGRAAGDRSSPATTVYLQHTGLLFSRIRELEAENERLRAKARLDVSGVTEVVPEFEDDHNL